MTNNDVLEPTHVVEGWDHIFADGEKRTLRLYVAKDAEGGWQLVAARKQRNGLLTRSDLNDVIESFDQNAAMGYPFDNEAQPMTQSDWKLFLPHERENEPMNEQRPTNEIADIARRILDGEYASLDYQAERLAELVLARESGRPTDDELLHGAKRPLVKRLVKRRTITIELPAGDTLSPEAFFDMQEAVAKAVKRHMKGQIGRALMRVAHKDRELTTERWVGA